MRRTVTLIAGFAVAAAGCAARRASTVEAHVPGAPSATRPAPTSATYALIGADGDQPIETVAVTRGRQIGFVRTGDGALVAYAAGHTIPLPEGSYSWRVVPGSPGPPAGSFSITDPEPKGGRAARVAVGTATLAGKIAVLMVRAMAGAGR